MQQIIHQLNRRVRNLFARAEVQLSDPSNKMQTVQLTVLADEVLDGVEHFEPHGFTSRPKAGAEAIIACPGGSRSHAIAIVVADRRYRLKTLAEGDVAMYDDAGNVIHLKQNGTIAVTSTTSVDVAAPEVTMTGNLTVTGDINAANVTASGDVSDSVGSMQGMRDVYNPHTHTSAAPGNPTSPPAGQM